MRKLADISLFETLISSKVCSVSVFNAFQEDVNGRLMLDPNVKYEERVIDELGTDDVTVGNLPYELYKICDDLDDDFSEEDFIWPKKFDGFHCIVYEIKDPRDGAVVYRVAPSKEGVCCPDGSVFDNVYEYKEDAVGDALLAMAEYVKTDAYIEWSAYENHCMMQLDEMLGK